MEGTRRHLEKDLESWRIIEDVQVKVEAQTKSTSGATRSPGPVCTKTGAQVAYVPGLERSLYGWKSKKITFPMVLVPCSNSFRVNGISLLDEVVSLASKPLPHKAYPLLRLIFFQIQLWGAMCYSGGYGSYVVFGVRGTNIGCAGDFQELQRFSEVYLKHFV
uniref:Uncharacterized protein n=1 Tax=Oryza sativa subsp. japonica TaxID=39947 RepID=Q7G3E2_ORYSJ|nr:hypothetical protein LOC_Os10g21820 [Oryza sativa Japonica Group]